MQWCKLAVLEGMYQVVSLERAYHIADRKRPSDKPQAVAMEASFASLHTLRRKKRYETYRMVSGDVII